MDIFLSLKQVVQEKLVSDPIVPGGQKNEKNANKITTTCNKYKQADVSQGISHMRDVKPSRFFPSRLLYL